MNRHGLLVAKLEEIKSHGHAVELLHERMGKDHRAVVLIDEMAHTFVWIDEAKARFCEPHQWLHLSHACPKLSNRDCVWMLRSNGFDVSRQTMTKENGILHLRYTVNGDPCHYIWDPTFNMWIHPDDADLEATVEVAC